MMNYTLCYLENEKQEITVFGEPRKEQNPFLNN